MGTLPSPPSSLHPSLRFPSGPLLKWKLEISFVHRTSLSVNCRLSHFFNCFSNGNKTATERMFHLLGSSQLDLCGKTWQRTQEWHPCIPALCPPWVSRKGLPAVGRDGCQPSFNGIATSVGIASLLRCFFGGDLAHPGSNDNSWEADTQTLALCFFLLLRLKNQVPNRK